MSRRSNAKAVEAYKQELAEAYADGLTDGKAGRSDSYLDYWMISDKWAGVVRKAGLKEGLVHRQRVREYLASHPVGVVATVELEGEATS